MRNLYADVFRRTWPMGLWFALMVGCAGGPQQDDASTIGSLKTADCLGRSGDQLTVVDPGSYSREFDVVPRGLNHTYDMRGTSFKANPPKRPVTFRKNVAGICVLGPRVVGQQGRDLSWADMKRKWDGDGVRFIGGSTPGQVTLAGAWIDNVEDGFEPPRYSNADPRYTWSLRHSYFRHIRDDVIENDRCLAGEVVDTLVDNSFIFISSRPGSGNRLKNGRTAPVIKVHDSLVHVGTEKLGGKLFKWPGSSSSCSPEPVLDVKNSVFRIDRAHHGSMDFPKGTYKNVTLVWLGGGEYPVRVPSGVVVKRDVGVWERARSEWLTRHGCDAQGDVCTRLLNADGPACTPECEKKACGAADGCGGVCERNCDSPVVPPSDGLNIRIASGVDDAEEDASGRVSIGSSDLELVRDGSLQTVGLRFLSVDIPREAKIKRAYIQFTVDEAGSDRTDLSFSGESTDNAAPFTTASKNLSSRRKTSTRVSWSPEPWSRPGSAGTAQQTPDLTAVIQEIVDRDGWRPKNAMVILVTGNGRRTVESYDGARDRAPLLHVEFEPEEVDPIPEPPEPPTDGALVEVRIGEQSDDAEEDSSGSVGLHSSDLEMVKEATVQTIGLRFRGITVPRGSTIHNAYVQFTVDETSSVPTNLVLRAEAADDAQTYRTSRQNISSRPTTRGSVTWSVPAWNREGEAGSAQRTPNLASIIQDVVDRNGWQSGNALALVVTGQGKRVAESVNGRPSSSALLRIEYGTGQGTPGPNEDPDPLPDPDTEAPVGSLSSPMDGDTVSGSVEIAATASDNVGIRSVQFRVDSELRCTVERAPYRCRWDTAAEGDGTVSLTALIVDASGNQTLTAPVTVRVDNNTNPPEQPEPPKPPSDSSDTINVPGDYARIQAAIDGAKPGDTIIVGPGRYAGGLIVDKQITLASRYHTTKDTAFIDQTTIDGGAPGIRVTARAQGARVVGFRFTGGRKSVQTFAFTYVLNNHFDDTGGDAISLEDVGGEVRGNHCFSPSDDCVDADGPLDALIEDNVILSAGDDGIEIRNFTHEGELVRITIRNNTIVGSREDAIQIIDYGGVANREFVIIGNVLADSTDVGIGLMDNAETIEDFRAASMPERILVFNNTLSGNTYGITGGDNMIVVNNIIANSSKLGVKNVDGRSALAHNLFWNNRTDQEGSRIDNATTVKKDPRLGDDFLLLPGSGAIDAGVDRYVPDGENRPVLDLSSSEYQGSAPDLGAFEHGF